MTVTNPPLATTQPAPSAGSPEQLLRGAGLLYATTIVQLVGRLVVTFIIARVLGAAGLGIFTLGFVTAQALTMLATNGQDIGLVKFVSPAHKKDDTATIRVMTDAALITSLAAAVVLMVGMIIFFPIYILASTGSASATAVAPWFAPVIVLQTAVSILSALGLARARPSVKAIPDKIFGTLGQIVVTVALLVAGFGLWGVVFGLLAGSMISLIVTIWLVRDLYPRRTRVSGRVAAIRQLVGYSWKLGLSNTAGYLLLNAALLVLGAVNATQAGLYAAASRLTLLGLLFLDAFGQNFAPHAAGKWGERSLQDDLQRITLWLVVLSAPIFMILFAFAPQWMSFLGPEFAAGAPVLTILALAQMINMLTGNAGMLIGVSNHPGLRAVNTVIAWGTNLVLVLVLAPRYGALGAAIAYLVAVILVDACEYIGARFVFGYSPWSKELLKPLLIIVGLTAILACANLFLQPGVVGAVIFSILGVVGYAGAMWFTGLPDVDVDMLKSMLRTLTRLAASRGEGRLGDV